MNTAKLTATKAGDINLKLTGLRNDKGKVMLMVYDSKEGFPQRSDDHEPFSFEIKDGAAQITITDLSIGEYAIAVFHDENKNGILDTNVIGVPKEGYGFSGKDRGRFAMPDYGKSSFTLTKERCDMNIAVHYIY